MKTKYSIYLLIFLFVFSACAKEGLNDDIGPMDNYVTDDSYTEGEQYEDLPENPFVSVADQPISTFAVDADGGSYANMRRYINNGQIPPSEAVRVEEFLNYFTFDYPDPESGNDVALNAEISTCPWNSEHHLMRLGLKGRSIAANDIPASNFVFLIDVSGSMNTNDKLGILKTGFKRMVDNLTQNDRIAIVTYAGTAGVLLPSTNGSETETIKTAIEQLGAGGSTAGSEGIKTAYEIARQNFIEGGNNRIILGSDGDFNVGITSTDELIQLIEQERESGIFLTVLGVGTGNLNDNMMEQIANNGNGNYEYIDSEFEVEKIFVFDKSKFFTVAVDGKTQVTFNPNMVSEYRLIGYENRVLANQEFENDTIDGGEIGAGQTITALYELILNNQPTTTEKYADFEFRYKEQVGSQSVLLNLELTDEPEIISEASDNQNFAASLAAFGLLLRQSQYAGTANKQMVLDLANRSLSFDPNQLRNQYLGLVNSWSGQSSQ